MSLYASNNSSDDLNISLNRMSINSNQNNNNNNNNNSSLAFLKIKNVPSNVTIREAYLIFSLCLDDVISVDIIHGPTNNNTFIIAKFSSIKIASQVLQLLNEKSIFGNNSPKIHCEVLNSHEFQTSTSSTNSATSANSANSYMFTNPFTSTNNDQSSPNEPTSTSQLQQQSEKSNNNNNNNNTQQQQQQQQHENLSIINTSTGNITGWSNETSTPLATPSNNSKIIRPDPLLLNNIGNMNINNLNNLNNMNNMNLNNINSMNMNNINNMNMNQLMNMNMNSALSATMSNDWSHPSAGNGFFNMNDLTSPVNSNYTPQHLEQQQPQPQQQQQQQQSHQSQSNTQHQSHDSQFQHNEHQYQQQPTNSDPSNIGLNNASRSSASEAIETQSNQSTVIPDLTLLARVPPPANPADQNPPCNTLYVGNLPPDTSENELRALFRLQPGFKRLSYRTKQTNGVSSHHGPMCFVEFEDVAYATKALAELYGRTLPCQSGQSNSKGGIRLSFSKNPLGVRGPGQQRRNNATGAPTGNVPSSSSSTSTVNNQIPGLVSRGSNGLNTISGNIGYPSTNGSAPNNNATNNSAGGNSSNNNTANGMINGFNYMNPSSQTQSQQSSQQYPF